jgi:hypothetical protein
MEITVSAARAGAAPERRDNSDGIRAKTQVAARRAMRETATQEARNDTAVRAGPVVMAFPATQSQGKMARATTAEPAGLAASIARHHRAAVPAAEVAAAEADISAVAAAVLLDSGKAAVPAAAEVVAAHPTLSQVQESSKAGKDGKVRPATALSSSVGSSGISLMRYALCGCVAAAMLAGCSGSQPPIGAPGAMPQAFANATHDDRGKSWMLPEAKGTKELLYISDQGTHHVYVYKYKTRRLLGRLNGFYAPAGQCVDSKGDVWITDSTAEAVVEFAHGALRRTKRIRTIGLANSCSIDPTSGGLAVSDANTPHGGSQIEIFDLTGKRKVYSNTSCQNIVQVGYDIDGNLYVSASSQASSSYVCELPHGGNALGQIPIDKAIRTPGGVMWDGQYITFTDRLYSFNYTAIYQAEPNSSGGLHVVGETVFQGGGSGDCKFSDIVRPFIVGNQNTPSNNAQGNAVVGSNDECHYGSGYAFSYWVYPNGGDPTHTLFDGPIDPSGEAVSIATVNL